MARPKHPRLEDRFGRIAIAIGGGILAAAGQAPLNWGLPTLLGLMIGAAVFSRQSTAKRSFATGWFFGAAYFATSLNWIVEPFFVDAAATGWMAPFALIGLSGGLALLWAFAWRLAFALGGGSFAWAVAMAGAELVRAYLFTGFPWAMPVYAWVNSVLIQIVSYAGPHGANLLLFLTAAFLVRGLQNPNRIAWRTRAGLGLAAALSILPLPRSAPLAEAGPLVRLIQPNIPQSEKWDPDKLEQFFDRQISLTSEDGEPDVVIWPETAVAFPIPYADRLFEEMAQAANGATVITGVQRLDDARTYNSMAVLDASGEVSQVYDKHHLVPFGEYFPLGQLVNRFGLHGLAAEEGVGYAKGPGPQILNIPPLGAVLPLICYEVVFPQDLRVETRPSVLLQITNDAWFGSFSGPYQHLAQARIRAIETGLPLVRVANTGVSAVIDPRGRVLAELPLGQMGKLDSYLPKALPITLYARSGDLPFILILICLVTFCAYRYRRNSN